MNKSICYKSNACSHTPSVVVTQTTEGLKGLANVFAYVASVNSTYYISGCHEITPIFQGDLFVDNYEYAANPLGIRTQTVYDFANNRAIVYNQKGEYRVMPLEEA